MADENEVKALADRLHKTANFRLGPLTIGDIAREALRWRDETRPVQAPPAAVPAGYALVPVSTLLDFKAWFSTSTPIGIALRKRVDELLAAAKEGE